jgi:hypothetical protein
VAPTRDLRTIAFIRAGVLLRRDVPVPGILATHRPGALMDRGVELKLDKKGFIDVNDRYATMSGRHFVARDSVRG